MKPKDSRDIHIEYKKPSRMRQLQVRSNMHTGIWYKTATCTAAVLLVLMLSTVMALQYEQLHGTADSASYRHAYGQSAALTSAAPIASHIVINEIDTNPPGNDAKRVSEWVEIYNPTSSKVDISGWEIASTTVLKKTMKISEGTTIRPGQFITYTYERIWFSDVGDIVELRDAGGNVIDATPNIRDTADDAKSWQRVYDGYVLNDGKDDWQFGTATPGSSNGKMLQGPSSDSIAISVDMDKKTYTFDETAVISGSVSESVFIEKPHFRSESITLYISGPSYSNSITLYPDYSLEFATSLEIKQVQNIDAGQYFVHAEYAGASANTTFTVGQQSIQNEQASHGEAISVNTDKTTYIPGQNVVISGAADKTVEFATFSLNVEDPTGEIIASGNPTPVNGAFEMQVFINSVNPAYGTYTINAEYGEKEATATFEVVKKTRGADRITLDTDMDAYMPGDVVTINGLLDGVWTTSLDVRILQTRQGALLDGGTGSHTGFKIDDSIQVSGDGTFSYTFSIPRGPSGLGDYKASFSGDIGAAGIVIHAVNDTESFVAIDSPLTLHTDRAQYVQNDEIIFAGYIRDISTGSTTEYATTRVYITMADADGNTIASQANSQDIRRGFAQNDGVLDYQIVAIPEESGRYTAKVDVYPNVFEEGNYTATATYRGHKATATFAVYDQYAITEPVISTDKDVYGLGQTVKLSGQLPYTGANQVKITLTRPDGSTMPSSATVEGQKFTWEWTAPSEDRTHSIKEGQLRGLTLSVFGVYKITIYTGSESMTRHFKLSEDPDNDTLADNPLSITTSKTLYKPGDMLLISGEVRLDKESDETVRIPQRVLVTVKSASIPFEGIYETRIYPDNAGRFSAEFTLPIGIFKEGAYKVTATYGTERVETSFSMANDYVVGSSKPISMHVKTDRDAYHPGETVTVTGGPNKIIFVDKYTISIAKKTDRDIECDMFGCGAHRGDEIQVKPDPTASFTYQFSIPDDADAIGTYEITAEARIGTVRTTFEVAAADMPQTEADVFVPEIIIDRYNRIPDTDISIEARADTALPYHSSNKTVGASPVSIVGSMITPGGQEESVNVRVLTENGTCVIGQSKECIISESTRSQGRVFDSVTLDDGSALRVIYTGPGERLEKFSIIPGQGQEFLPDMTWNVQILKDDPRQASVFYYKVSYMTTE